MRRRVTVASQVGLHARPAALLASKAAEQSESVRIAKVTDDGTGEFVDAASVLGLMTLGARHGEQVELDCADEGMLEAVAEVIENDHDASEATA